MNPHKQKNWKIVNKFGEIVDSFRGSRTADEHLRKLQKDFPEDKLKKRYIEE